MENKVYEGIYYSRFVASWVKVRGNVKFIKGWLRQLKINGKRIPEDIIQEIYNFANDGFLELQENAQSYLMQPK